MIESHFFSQIDLNLLPSGSVKSFSDNTIHMEAYGRNLSSIFHACLTLPAHHTKSIFHTNFEEPKFKICADSLLNMYRLNGRQPAEVAA